LASQGLEGEPDRQARGVSVLIIQS
jgi:hypothetical protein